jgi:Na+/H+ antiporter NhaC
MQRDGIRLRSRLRVTFYVVFALLFISGVAWFILHTWARHPSEFGSEELNAFEPWLLKVHGAAAMVALVLLGVLYPVHIMRGWRAHRNRRSGAGLVAICLSLIVTGYLLYYVGGETSRAVTSLLHLWIGFALPAMIAIHIWRGRASRAGR